MADLTFTQPARRNLLVPILLALVVLAGAVFAVLRYTPRTTADVAVTRVSVFPSHVVFKSGSIVLNSDQVQDDLYVLVTLRLTNHLRLPLFLKDFTGTLTPSAAIGGAPISESAIEKPDLANLFVTFPGLKKAAEAQGAPPLYRDTRIDPGKTAEGYIALHFSGKPALWDERASATLAIDLYHQQPLAVPIPNSAAVSPGAAAHP